MSLVTMTLERFFEPPPRPGRRGGRPLQAAGVSVPVAAGELIVVAFSGGPDSTALLCGLARLAPARGLRLLAAHLDHGLDPGSAGRAGRARRLAESLGVEAVVERREVARLARPGESPEAAARRVRYRFLEEVRRECGGRWIATAHHRDDQAETVVLRLLQGSGADGLAGIQPVRGRVVRPLLELPGAELERELAAAPAAHRRTHPGAVPGRAPRPGGGPRSVLEPAFDPSNGDLRIPRNRVRRALLPALERAEPGAGEALARLAGAARRARAALDRRLDRLLAPARAPGGDGVAVRRSAFSALPEPLRPHALALLHRRAGARYPASGAARAELARQLGSPRVGCDCPGGWRWESAGALLVLRRRPEAPPRFSYTLPLPGEVSVPELGVTVRIRRERVAPWMFRGSPRRAALVLPLEPGDRLEVRSRRPGDRLRPLGAPGTRKLKDLLIDRRVPRRERDRLPLLCAGGRIAWVPGVTVEEAFRLPHALPDGGGETWTAEVIP